MIFFLNLKFGNTVILLRLFRPKLTTLKATTSRRRRRKLRDATSSRVESSRRRFVAAVAVGEISSTPKTVSTSCRSSTESG